MCDPTFMENLAQETKIKIWRLNNGLNVEQAAKRLGISKSYMSMLESGDREPSAAKRIRFKELTGGFVGFEDWPSKTTNQ